MTNNNPIVSDANKRAYMKLLGKEEFVDEEWFGFTVDLNNFLLGRLDMSDFINDYYLDYKSVLNYASRHFGKKYTESLKKHRKDYEDFYKEFDLKSYLDGTTIIVDDKARKPSIEELGKAFCYLDDAGIPLCNGNMNVAIRAIMRGQISVCDPIEERRENLKNVCSNERKARQYTLQIVK